MNTIHWDKSQRRERDGRTVYLTECGCGNTRYLTRSDALRSNQCYNCSQTEKAKKGFAATCRRHGEQWAVGHVQAYRQANRTPQEKIVDGWLRDNGFTFHQEYKLVTKAKKKKRHAYLIDCMVQLYDTLFAIEINGGCHINKTKKDRRKLSLLKRRNIPALVLTNKEVESGSFIPTLLTFLGVSEEIAA